MGYIEYGYIEIIIKPIKQLKISQSVYPARTKSLLNLAGETLSFRLCVHLSIITCWDYNLGTIHHQAIQSKD